MSKKWTGEYDLDGDPIFEIDDAQYKIWTDNVDRNDPNLPIKERGGWQILMDGYYWFDSETKKQWGPYKTADELVKAVEVNQKLK